MYGNEELLRQLDELRTMFAENKAAQNDDTFKQLYKPVTVTWEIYRLAVRAADLWDEITKGTEQEAVVKSVEFNVDMMSLKDALDRYEWQQKKNGEKG